MKKFFLFLFIFLIFICNVKAEDSYFMWHNSIDNAYTTSYDGMISNEVGKFQNDTIESLGNYRVRLNNFNTYDVILNKETTWELSGENIIDFIEENDNSVITLKGNGVLKFQEIGLSITDLVNYKTPNLEERIKTYLKGDYTLSVEEKYIVIRLNDTNNSTNNFVENINTKSLSFENKGFKISIKSNSKVPLNTVFIAENKLESLKDEIQEKLEKEEIKYIYDFKLQDGENLVEPSEEVEVSIKLNNGEYLVYYYNNAKELEKLDSKFENGALIFKTYHFSEYVITSPKEVETKENIEDKEEEKKDYTLITCTSIFIISLIILLIVIFIGKKK